jgi:tetratricopeptide (TPR) repeat protein
MGCPDQRITKSTAGTNIMNFSGESHYGDSKADRAPDEFPGIDGQCSTPVEDAGEVPVSELVLRGALFNEARRPVLAARSFFQAMRQTRDLEEKARLAVAVGGLAETVGRFEVAVSFYRAAIALQPSETKTRYFAQNNLGYSLNQQSLYEKGEIHCRNAIEIDPQRPNGYKNLGLSLWGLLRFREAALCFVEATRANALDPRSTKHLKDLLEERPEIAEEFADAMEWCQKVVGDARRPKSAVNAADTNPNPDQRGGNLLN